MAHAENEITINKPVATVYAFVADGLNNPKWRSAVLSISLASGTGGSVGAVYKQALKGPGGRKIDGDYRVTEAIPDSRVTFEVITGPARPRGAFYLEPAGAGTKLRFVLDLQPKGFAKLMNGMIEKTMRAEVANLDQLKEVLERSS